MLKWIILFFTALVFLLIFSACALSPERVSSPEPSLQPCAFELPALSGYELHTKNNGSMQFVFGDSEPPEEWLLVTDEHSDANVYINEDGGMAIELPGDYQIEPLENGRVLLHLPGCRQLKE